MKQTALYTAIVLSMGIAGAGLAHADDQAVPVTATGSTINLGSITLTPGGFIEGAMIDRNRNEVADDATKLQGIPKPTTDEYYTNEFRMSGRQSRVSLLAQGPDMDGAKAEAYYEADFLGVGTSSNSQQSNSYVLRVRQAFADYTMDSGFQILAGQAWSLITQNKTAGINARGENVPLTIDAQYVAGFNWTRNSQVRFTEKFSDMFTGAISLESPQATAGGTAPAAGSSAGFPTGSTITTVEPGGSGLNNACLTSAPNSGSVAANTCGASSASYSTDPLPDVIVKVAVDPGFGHYELLAMDRHFRDRADPAGVVANGSSSTTSATSFGGSFLLPIIPKGLELQASYLTGKGVGRYGTSSFADYTYKADGSPDAIKGTDYLLGIVGHPDKQWDIYAYAGAEKLDSTTDSTTGTTPNVGYGLTTCGAAAFTCTALQKVSEITAGFWYKFYQGQAQHMQVGLQFGKITDTYFADSSGNDNKVSMNEVMASFRYYPFSK